MDVSVRLSQLEDELKVLKNEVLAVLLDVKEKMLSQESPFAPPAAPAERPSIIINQAPPPAGINASVAAAPAVDRGRAAPPPGSATGSDGNGTHRRTENSRDTQRADDEYPRRVERRRAESGPASGQNKNEGLLKPFWLPDDRADAVEAEADRFNGALPFTVLAAMVKWVETTATQLGGERTRTILDVSEMMGQMPAELRNILEKLIPAELLKRTPEKIYARDYLNSLKELARLLGSKNTADFVALHIVSHGLNAMTRNGPDG